MPVMDGFKVLECLQEKKVLNKMPFKMVTSQDSSEFEKKVMNTGL